MVIVIGTPSFRVSVEDPYITITNDYSREYVVKAVEVEYEVSTARVKPGLPYEEDSVVSPVRRITERISLGVRLRPGESHSIYFGSTQRIRGIVAVISLDDKDYRVRAEIRRKEAEEKNPSGQ